MTEQLIFTYAIAFIFTALSIYEWVRDIKPNDRKVVHFIIGFTAYLVILIDQFNLANIIMPFFMLFTFVIFLYDKDSFTIFD